MCVFQRDHGIQLWGENVHLDQMSTSIYLDLSIPNSVWWYKRKKAGSLERERLQFKMIDEFTKRKKITWIVCEKKNHLLFSLSTSNIIWSYLSLYLSMVGHRSNDSQKSSCELRLNWTFITTTHNLMVEVLFSDRRFSPHTRNVTKKKLWMILGSDHVIFFNDFFFVVHTHTRKEIFFS